MSTFENGGGFTNSQGGSGSQQQREKKTMTIRPVTCKQVNEAVEPKPDDETHIDGVALDRIALVACIRNVSDASGHATLYKLEDGTGSVEVKQWKESKIKANDDDDEDMEKQEEEEQESEFKVGEYVFVMGSTRVFNGKRSINVNRIRAVTDFNEVIYHHAKALAVHLHYTRGPVDGGNGAAAGDGGTATANNDNNNDSLFVQGAQIAGVQKKIMDVLKKSNTEVGVHYDQLARELKLDNNSVIKELEDMEQSGVIYQADDDHYLAID